MIGYEELHAAWTETAARMTAGGAPGVDVLLREGGIDSEAAIELAFEHQKATGDRPNAFLWGLIVGRLLAGRAGVDASD